MILCQANLPLYYTYYGALFPHIYFCGFSLEPTIAMQVSSSSVSRAAQPEQRREGLKQAGDVPSFQQPVRRTRPQHHNGDNHIQRPPIPNIGLPEKDSEYVHGIDIGEAQFEVDFAKNGEDYRANIPPTVPYYGLERAVDLLEFD